MNLERAATQHMELREYLQRMGEKFTPTAKSIQMEAEYRSRKQGKNEAGSDKYGGRQQHKKGQGRRLQWTRRR